MAVIALCAWVVPAVGSAQLEDVTAEVGLDGPQGSLPLATRCGSDTSCWVEVFAGGAAIDDLDGDGDLDVVMSRVGMAPVIFRFDGERFIRETMPSGFGDGTNGVAIVDLDRDGDRDIVFSTYRGGVGVLLG